MRSKISTRITMVFTTLLMFSFFATAQTTITVTIANEADDAEEGENGLMANESSDLELGRWDDWTQNDTAQGVQIIGIKFDTIPITKGSTISAASIQFTADNTGADPVQLTIFGENVANPESYKDADLNPEDHFFNITTRPKTLESVVWDVPEWPNTGLAGPDQATPDIAAIVQAIVDRDDWASGNSMAFILEHSGPSIGVTSSSGGREAEAGPGDDAPTLIVTYE